MYYPNRLEHYKLTKKKVKKFLFIFLGLFIVVNILLYTTEYKRYVSKAPEHLIEARKDMVKAYIVHFYYAFFVKMVRIDFLNPVIYPIKILRDYFYHNGLEKMPKNEAERALWFELFEANLYNASVEGSYGSMARHYGVEFSKEFIEKVYENLELLSKNKIDDTYAAKNLVGRDIINPYLNLMDVYLADFHLHPEGYIYQKENMQKVEKDKELHNRFINIYHWQKDFLSYYKKNHLLQYNHAFKKYKGWNSPFQIYHTNMFMITTFIVYYKVRNNTFLCSWDKQYLNSIEKARDILVDFTKRSNVSSDNVDLLNKEISYLHLTNKSKKSKYDKKEYFLDCKY